MEAIWKFEIITTDSLRVEIPLGAKILTVQVQNGIPCLWCLVDVEKEKVSREIRVIGTGQPIESDFKGEYVGTYQLFNGTGVFHLFLL